MNAENCRIAEFGIKCELLGFNNGKAECGFSGRPIERLTSCPAGTGPLVRPTVFERMTVRQVLNFLAKNP